MAVIGRAAAVAEIAALCPDVVVVDIALREGTGFHVLDAIGIETDRLAPGELVVVHHRKGHVMATQHVAAARAGLSVLVDPKGSDYSRYAGATAIAAVFLVASFALLLTVNLVSRRRQRRFAG